MDDKFYRGYGYCRRCKSSWLLRIRKGPKTPRCPYCNSTVTKTTEIWEVKF